MNKEYFRKEYFDYSNKKYVIRVWSGNIVIKEERHNVEEGLKLFRCQGLIVTVKQFLHQGCVVESYVKEFKKEQDYLDDMKELLGKSAPRNMRALLKTIEEVKLLKEVKRSLDQLV